ncbi:hypothetical protein Tco_0430803 [Tanacetum coccineum]
MGNYLINSWKDLEIVLFGKKWSRNVIRADPCRALSVEVILFKHCAAFPLREELEKSSLDDIPFGSVA